MINASHRQLARDHSSNEVSHRRSVDFVEVKSPRENERKIDEDENLNSLGCPWCQTCPCQGLWLLQKWLENLGSILLLLKAIR